MENILHSEQKMQIFKHLMFIENKDFLNYIQSSIDKFISEVKTPIEEESIIEINDTELLEDENEIFDEGVDENLFLEDFNLTVGELRKKVKIEEQAEEMTKEEFFKSYEKWRAAKDV